MAMEMVCEKSWLYSVGDNQSEVLKLDQQKFKRKFIDLSQTYDKIDSRICFELIHKAFDKAYFKIFISQKIKHLYHLHKELF